MTKVSTIFLCSSSYFTAKYYLERDGPYTLKAIKENYQLQLSLFDKEKEESQQQKKQKENEQQQLRELEFAYGKYMREKN